MDGLIIEEEWLNLIFEGKKVVEVRSSNIKKRGFVALICSGTGRIYGIVNIHHCFKMSLDDFKSMKNLHRVEEPIYKNNFAWCLKSARKFNASIAYKHPQGAVIWVKDVL